MTYREPFIAAKLQNLRALMGRVKSEGFEDEVKAFWDAKNYGQDIGAYWRLKDDWKATTTGYMRGLQFTLSEMKERAYNPELTHPLPPMGESVQVIEEKIYDLDKEMVELERAIYDAEWQLDLAKLEIKERFGDITQALWQELHKERKYALLSTGENTDSERAIRLLTLVNELTDYRD